MTDWLKTMYAIRGIQSIFAVTVFGQSPQMIGYLEKNWTHANGNEYRTIVFSPEIFSRKLEKALAEEFGEETLFCK